MSLLYDNRNNRTSFTLCMTMISIFFFLLGELRLRLWLLNFCKEHCFHVLLEILALALIDLNIFDFLGGPC